MSVTKHSVSLVSQSRLWWLHGQSSLVKPDTIEVKREPRTMWVLMSIIELICSQVQGSKEAITKASGLSQMYFIQAARKSSNCKVVGVSEYTKTSEWLVKHLLKTSLSGMIWTCYNSDVGFSHLQKTFLCSCSLSQTTPSSHPYSQLPGNEPCVQGSGWLLAVFKLPNRVNLQEGL